MVFTSNKSMSARIPRAGDAVQLRKIKMPAHIGTGEIRERGNWDHLYNNRPPLK